LAKKLKGTVQRELRGVKIGINRFFMMYSLAVNCLLPCPKGHHHERSINVLSGCSTFNKKNYKIPRQHYVFFCCCALKYHAAAKFFIGGSESFENGRGLGEHNVS
jgi:hypothetical protein